MSSPGWSRTTDSPASASQVITGVCCHYNSYSQVRKDTGWQGAVAQLPHHINANSLSSCQHRDSAAWLGPVPRCRHPRNSRLSRWKVSYSSPGFNSTGGNHVISSSDPEKAAQKSKTVSCLKYIQLEKKKSLRQQEGRLSPGDDGTDSPEPHGSGKVNWNWGWGSFSKMLAAQRRACGAVGSVLVAVSSMLKIYMLKALQLTW